MQRILHGDNEPRTWAQSIQAYQRGKKELPWNPADVSPPKYVKQFDVSRRSREMDPVLMRHRNPDVEANRLVREEERVRAAINNAKSRQLRLEQDYDIVTHSSFLPEKQHPPTRPVRHPDTRTSYDILNHVPRDKAHSVALIYGEGEGPEVLPQKAVLVEGGKKPHSHLKRDVDVLSNRFLEKHEERMVEEQRFLRESAEEKYRRTHDYNIIAGTFYDRNKERDFVESREKLEAMQGRAQQYRFPPSMRYGEGNDYNIINQEPKNTVVKNKPASVADRGLSKRTRGRQAHEENIRRHERAAALGEERTLNRPSHMRHVEVLRTGHNVVSNEVFTGREGKPPPQPRARPPVPVWDRLSGQSKTSRSTADTWKNQTEEEHGACGGNDSASSRGGQPRQAPGGDGEGDVRPGVSDGDREERGVRAGRPDAATGEIPGPRPPVPPLDLSRRPET